MSDTTANAVDAKSNWLSEENTRRVKRRYAADFRMRMMGLGAISLAMLLLLILLGSIVLNGYSAFWQTHVTLEVYIDPDKVNEENLRGSNFRGMVKEGLLDLFPEVTKPADQRKLFRFISRSGPHALRLQVLDDEALVGQRIEVALATSDPIDQLHKGVIPRDVPEDDRRIKDDELVWYDKLVDGGYITTPFSWALFFNSDSRFPEAAGLAGAITGSFYALLVCFLISFPVGIAAAVYLEEFAPQNRWTDIIEVNINNLAAVPSVVFGLLGLAVFIGVFGLPRSAPLVGGMTLSLMTLPTIIIATRAALKAVPPSIREAALGVGASKHQVMTDHVLPLAMPGILTGTIIGLAQALGETAPLLLIGMNAFITSPPGGIFDAATALPTQIYIWADSPERGFVARTSAGILVLLGFLVAMNMFAVFLRSRFERTW